LPIKILEEPSEIESGKVAVYIRADASLAVGSPVEFEITLPPELMSGQHNVVIQCRGRVVLTDEFNAGAGSRDHRGAACAIDSYKLLRNA
jgi:hypothetical protein